jgi:hypothetical protein
MSSITDEGYGRAVVSNQKRIRVEHRWQRCCTRGIMVRRVLIGI